MFLFFILVLFQFIMFVFILHSINFAHIPLKRIRVRAIKREKRAACCWLFAIIIYFNSISCGSLCHFDEFLSRLDFVCAQCATIEYRQCINTYAYTMKLKLLNEMAHFPQSIYFIYQRRQKWIYSGDSCDLWWSPI